jgi:lipopolysaccharide exporter
MASFFENVLKLVSASIISQILGVILLPIVTRLYSPADFGIFQLFISLTSIIVILAPMSYQFALMLPKTDEDAFNILILSILCSIFIAIGASLLFWGFSSTIFAALNAPLLSQYLIFFPILVLVQSLFSIQNYWLMRSKQFGIISFAQVANSISTKVAQITIGVISASPFGLLLGVVLGYSSGNMLMANIARNDKHLLSSLNFSRMRKLAGDYIKFPLYTTGSLLMNEISFQIAPFFLAFFFSPIIVGYYSLAHIAVNLPSGLIGRATQQVFFQRVSEEKNISGDVKNIVAEVYRRLISIGLFPILVLMVISENLFIVFFGENWYFAGIYAKILAPYIFLAFLSYPLSSLFATLERQEVGFRYQAAILASRFGALLIGGLLGDPIYALILFSFTGVVFNGWMNHYLLMIAGIESELWKKVLFRYLFISVVLVIPLVIVKYLQFSNLIIIISAAMTGIIYYLFVVFDDPVLRKEVLKLRKIVKR